MALGEDLLGFRRFEQFWERIHEDFQGFARCWEALGEDL